MKRSPSLNKGSKKRLKKKNLTDLMNEINMKKTEKILSLDKLFKKVSVSIYIQNLDFSFQFDEERL